MKRLVLSIDRQVRRVTTKKIIALLTVLSSVFFSAGATAQNQPLACQVEASAGLSWENGRWVTTRFREERFLLVQTKDGLTTDSVAKAFRYTVPEQVACNNVLSNISCTSVTGLHLYFDPRNLTGGISYLLGATGATRADRDSPYVSVFSCTLF